MKNSLFYFLIFCFGITLTTISCAPTGEQQEGTRSQQAPLIGGNQTQPSVQPILPGSSPTPDPIAPPSTWSESSFALTWSAFYDRTAIQEARSTVFKSGDVIQAGLLAYHAHVTQLNITFSVIEASSSVCLPVPQGSARQTVGPVSVSETFVQKDSSQCSSVTTTSDCHQFFVPGDAVNSPLSFTLEANMPQAICVYMKISDGKYEKFSSKYFSK